MLTKRNTRIASGSTTRIRHPRAVSHSAAEYIPDWNMGGGEPMDIGKFLRQCRKDHGMKQEELAFALNINQSDVSKIERGEKYPALDIFRNWTVQTQAIDLGIAFLYGTEILNTLPDIINTMSTMVAGIIHLF
ncbi:XRE family transcriptional regulator [Sporosarcina sp. P35]|nr:XRE family transcriptional regulator [Sporosarcina sp. P35]